MYEKMRNKFGVKPRVFLYNRVMDALVRTGHLDLALSVYDDLKEDGLVEESVTFMVLVKGLCKCGRIDEMLEVLGRMRERLCKPGRVCIHGAGEDSGACREFGCVFEGLGGDEEGPGGAGCEGICYHDCGAGKRGEGSGGV